jgi:hypothetical protein
VSGLVERWFELAIADAMLTLPGDHPEEMRDPSLDEDDWLGWKPIPSTVTDDQLAKLDKLAGGPLPELYRAMLKHRHFLELNVPGVRMVRHAPDDLGELRDEQTIDLYTKDSEQLLPAHKTGVFIIGDDDNDGGPVCLAIDEAAGGEYPVVFVEHENGERTRMFSSFQKMLECQILLMEQRDGAPYSEAVVERFFALDPGADRQFWEWRLLDE